ncbi:MAG: cadmium-translocating P-type ATPase, partial [Desulfobacterales bacterium]|nr:cadmium-translocating P-type ATPase [Desulfobacterales bacterium]
MQKYRVNNLDCAVCAQKLEDALNNTQGVRAASIDFGTLTLHLDADDTDAARRVVKEVEPGVELEPLSRPGRREAAGAGEAFRLKSEIAKIAAAAVLFVLVLVCDYYEGLGVPSAAFAALLAAAYLAAGGRVLAAAGRTVARRDFFDENVLMAIATIGAIAIGAFSEAVGVMAFYRAGEFLQNLAVSRSRRSIASLLGQRPEFANLKTPEGVSRVAPESVSVNDVIVVKPGEKIPLDGSILEGDSQVDTSVLTGESVPRRVEDGDLVMAGGINMYGTILVEVTKPFAESSIAKMVELVENAAARKSTTENFITVFARYYTPAVVLAAMGVAFIPPLFITGASLEQWVYRALVLLVISCPCALVISIPLGYFGGIGRASRHGILVKGSNFIDALAGLRTVIFDKTGTLTEGVFEVEQVVHQNGYSPEQVLEFAAMAEQYSNHPIARAIVAAYENKGHRVDPERINAHAETSGSGVRVEFDGTAVIVGNDRYMHSHEIPHDQGMIEGTVAHVAVAGKYAGYILIGDRIREAAGPAIASLRANGIDRILMLTG